MPKLTKLHAFEIVKDIEALVELLNLPKISGFWLMLRHLGDRNLYARSSAIGLQGYECKMNIEYTEYLKSFISVTCKMT